VKRGERNTKTRATCSKLLSHILERQCECEVSLQRIYNSRPWSGQKYIYISDETYAFTTSEPILRQAPILRHPNSSFLRPPIMGEAPCGSDITIPVGREIGPSPGNSPNDGSVRHEQLNTLGWPFLVAYVLSRILST